MISQTELSKRGFHTPPKPATGVYIDLKRHFRVIVGPGDLVRLIPNGREIQLECKSVEELDTLLQVLGVKR